MRAVPWTAPLIIRIVPKNVDPPLLASKRRQSNIQIHRLRAPGAVRLLGSREVGVVEQREHIGPLLAVIVEGAPQEGLGLDRELARELELLRLGADVVRLHAHDLVLRRLVEEGLVRVEERDVVHDAGGEDVHLRADARGLAVVTLRWQEAVRARAVRRELHRRGAALRSALLRRGHDLREAEVAELDLAVMEEDVGRLEVEVDDGLALAVQVPQPVQHLHDDGLGVFLRQRSVPATSKRPGCNRVCLGSDLYF